MEKISSQTAKVGERIREIRTGRKLGVSVAGEISEKYQISLTPASLSRMERGLAEIPIKTLLALADFFDVTAAELVDPGHDGELDEFLFILKDRKLMRQIAKLGERLGPHSAKQQIKAHLGIMLKVLESK